jgi:L-alanine-DL-glutamate epimerase-like enolase superfamily enzyme
MLRIENVRAELVSVPLSRPVISSIHNISRIGVVIVSVETSAGVTGEGLLFTLDGHMLRSLKSVVEELGRISIGEDAEAFEHVWSKIYGRMQFFGSGGFLVFALSGIDMAIWDAVGKYQKRSMRQMLGGGRTQVPTYASDALFLDRSLEELVEEARMLVAQGYTAMKIRVSGRNIDDDVRRVRAVRDAIGDRIALMADANQALDLNGAIALGRRLEEFNLAWFEEPIPAHQFEAYSILAAALDTPIATGESNYTRHEIKQLIDGRGADILMPDLSRIGGFTELRKVAALAEASDIAITPHLYPEHCIGAVASFPNATYVEHMGWFSPLLKEPAEFADGAFAVPERFGIGFTVDTDKKVAWAVS